MKHILKMSFVFLIFTLLIHSSNLIAISTKVAPDFTLPDQEGTTRSLKDYKGKFVVLEWYNKDCPFVKKFYDAGKMQELQKEAKDQGVVWLSIISSAPEKQGHMNGSEIKAQMKNQGSVPTAVLIDANGEVGKSYGAKTTPQMVVISPKQEILYEGAIDDRPSTEASSLKGARNYVQEALKLAMAGKEVKVKRAQSYGCSIKY